MILYVEKYWEVRKPTKNQKWKYADFVYFLYFLKFCLKFAHFALNYLKMDQIPISWARIFETCASAKY